jgi:hypothetical protein
MKRACLVCLLTTILLALLSPAPLCSDTTRHYISRSGESDLSPHKESSVPGEWFFQRRAVTSALSGLTSMLSAEPPPWIGFVPFASYADSTSQNHGTEPASVCIYLTNLCLRR